MKIGEKIVYKYENNSLVITPELCSQKQACKVGEDFLKNFYPNGFTVDQVYKKEVRHIPMRFIHWGYFSLPFTNEDREKYLEFCDIKECNNFYMSDHIDLCKNISYSQYCSKSYNITKSKDIIESNNISNSNRVTKSSYIDYGSDIVESSYVYIGNNIEKTKCAWDSHNIKNSIMVNKSTKVDNGLFVNFSSGNNIICSTKINKDNRIFCTANCDNSFEYAIFNCEVKETEFLRVYKKLKEVLENELNFLSIDEKDNYFNITKKIFNSNLIWYGIKDALEKDSFSKEERILIYSITLSDKIFEI